MLEKDVEQYLCKRVRNDLQGMALKFICPGFNGVPDRIILLPGGKAVFVELKAPGKKPRKLQVWVHKSLAKLGFRVLVIDTKEKADNFVKEAREDGV